MTERSGSQPTPLDSRRTKVDELRAQLTLLQDRLRVLQHQLLTHRDNAIGIEAETGRLRATNQRLREERHHMETALHAQLADRDVQITALHAEVHKRDEQLIAAFARIASIERFLPMRALRIAKRILDQLRARIAHDVRAGK
jgi:hypothetical protein